MHDLYTGEIYRPFLLGKGKSLDTCYGDIVVGCVAQVVERRSLTGELSLSCTRPAADW